ncbi:50S ribosomal protein L18 [Metamycoplasma hyosynoviae]|uniref:Large ribosomal subunit protein uL18 n=1 Tax=Metamycoplasma hyosynoviae TaxID=29559 RepID=A0A063YJ26_9BACT|nr:50S ribosomal protein L18 [Metamycoplasma hyosynoviae]ASI53921.1 50S ribosomal protein L18 [Metamycoplasma hyosynoviae]KDE41937.1 50S ribosomal protein L18 [Metamycoplasma hyosynoviae]KDE41984.1 50S ribosomal protein L18 [Metamycoplasma hyosynoviae]KDE43229.1 50S ribosomal protein L18 [Metamycoplasma hyosynoviae]KDE43345.1 50S ribosomal protein L18 [Metamycoplasma hyosynoviae]
MQSRNEKRVAKHLKITNKLSKGTAKVPRVCVFKSLHHFYAQAINDEKHITLASYSTQKLAKKANNIEAVKAVAKGFADALKNAKIKQIVFDRSGYIYHGKVKAFCEVLRAEGIKF